MKQAAKYVANRLKEPTTWASIAAVVAVFKPELAHQMAAVAALLGAVLPEGAAAPADVSPQ